MEYQGTEISSIEVPSFQLSNNKALIKGVNQLRHNISINQKCDGELYHEDKLHESSDKLNTISMKVYTIRG